jgi:hypothetical protein
VISNIYDGGLPPVEAGSVIAERAIMILDYGAAGNRLESLSSERDGTDGDASQEEARQPTGTGKQEDG